MKKVIIEYDVCFINGLNKVFKCSTLLEAFCMGTLWAIENAYDTTIHHINYQRECALRPTLTFK